MSVHIPSVVIRRKEIVGRKTAYDLMKEGIEELMVCDLDSIIDGKTNFKLYNELSKFFEFTVFNLIYTVGDLVDSFVAGASKVVVSPDLTADRLVSFLEISQNVVDPNSSRFSIFQKSGGKYVMVSGRMPYQNFSGVYNIGPSMGGDNTINVDNFPSELNHFIT
jgi:hypothetical protein